MIYHDISHILFSRYAIYRYNIMIWYDDPKVLVSDMSAFFPHKNMNFDEKMNALMRFAIYFGVIMSVAQGTPSGIYFIMAVVVFTYLCGRSLSSSTSSDIVLEDPLRTPINLQDPNPGSAAPEYMTPALKATIERQKETCTKPTQHNPFSNFDLINGPIDDPNRPPACYHGDVASEINEHFNYNLYMDADMLFNKSNSQRQFITMPNTKIVNDQTAFAKALYLIPEGTCKTNQDNCGGDYPSSDLRYHRGILIDPDRPLV